MGPGRIGTALAMVLLLAPMAVHAASFDTIVIDDNMGGAKGNGDYAVGQGATRQEAERIAMSNCTLAATKPARSRSPTSSAALMHPRLVPVSLVSGQPWTRHRPQPWRHVMTKPAEWS